MLLFHLQTNQAQAAHIGDDDDNKVCLVKFHRNAKLTKSHVYKTTLACFGLMDYDRAECILYKCMAEPLYCFSGAAWYAVLLLLFTFDQTIKGEMNKWGPVFLLSIHCTVPACYYDWFGSGTYIAWRAYSDCTSSPGIAKCFKSIDLPELQHGTRPLTCL